MDELKQLIIQLNKQVIERQKKLNDFVIDNKNIILPDDEEFRNEFTLLMDKIVDFATEVRKEHEPEEFLAELSSLQNEDNANYISWLLDYMEKGYRIFSDAIPFQNMDINKFQVMVDFCVQNYVLHNISPNEISKEWKEMEQDLKKLKRVIFRYINWYFWENHSAFRVIEEMKSTFDLKEEYVSIIQKSLENNEEKLWKIYLNRRLNYIEDTLDEIYEWVMKQI